MIHRPLENTVNTDANDHFGRIGFWTRCSLGLDYIKFGIPIHIHCILKFSEFNMKILETWIYIIYIHVFATADNACMILAGKRYASTFALSPPF